MSDFQRHVYTPNPRKITNLPRVGPPLPVKPRVLRARSRGRAVSRKTPGALAPTHLVIMHRERFQIIRAGARNHLNVINLLHGSLSRSHTHIDTHTHSHTLLFRLVLKHTALPQPDSGSVYRLRKPGRYRIVTLLFALKAACLLKRVQGVKGANCETGN